MTYCVDRGVMAGISVDVEAKAVCAEFGKPPTGMGLAIKAAPGWELRSEPSL